MPPRSSCSPRWRRGPTAGVASGHRGPPVHPRLLGRDPCASDPVLFGRLMRLSTRHSSHLLRGRARHLGVRGLRGQTGPSRYSSETRLAIPRREEPVGTSAAPPTRDRLVEVASRLCSAEGIRPVGVERVVDDAGVDEVTLSAHLARGTSSSPPTPRAAATGVRPPSSREQHRLDRGRERRPPTACRLRRPHRFGGVPNRAEGPAPSGDALASALSHGRPSRVGAETTTRLVGRSAHIGLVAGAASGAGSASEEVHRRERQHDGGVLVERFHG